MVGPEGPMVKSAPAASVDAAIGAPPPAGKGPRLFRRRLRYRLAMRNHSFEPPCDHRAAWRGPAILALALSAAGCGSAVPATPAQWPTAGQAKGMC